MRIIHIIPNLKKGGAERLVLDICAALQKQEGIKVLLITFSNENEYQNQTKNIPWRVVKIQFKLSILKNNTIDIAELQKVIDEFNPDIIHTHLYEAELISRSCYYPQAKWFTHCHSNMPQFTSKGKNLKEKLVQQFEKKYLFNQYQKNGGTHFIAISKHTFRYFKGKVKKYPIKLLNNAIDYKKFYCNIENKTIHETLQLISVGSVKPLKNHIFLIQVAKKLKEKNISFNLKVLGDGESKNNLKKKVVEYNLQNEVVFLGNVENVENYLWASDIYLHSSKSEALGLTIIEAMAAGLPVVTLDGGGNRDLIQEGKNGFLIEKENIDEYVLKVLFLKNNYNKISKFAQYFSYKFDINSYIDKLITIYKRQL